jgi:predicted metal-dependent peptidase
MLERPFLGALVMHLPFVVTRAPWCRTFASDARTLYFDPGYVEALDFQETQFVLAHAALHCALGHFARRNHRERKRWEIATDHAVNLLLADDGLKAPAGALLNPAFRGLAAEEIYPLIPAASGSETLDRHVFDAVGAPDYPHVAARNATPAETAGAGGEVAGVPGGEQWDDAGDERRRHPYAALQPGAPSAAMRAELARVWQERLAAAAQQARRAGRLGASWLRAIDGLIQPRLPWRSLLARFMMSVARDDFSFQRPSRRGGEVLLPGLKSAAIDLCVALDTSGSIGDEELREFTGEIDALKGQIRARVTVLACDEALGGGGPWTFEAWEPIHLPRELRGGGGTRFTPVFEWLERERRCPDLLVYFTDAEGEFPAAAPAYPVVWLVKGKGAVPWGERIQLN